MDMEKTNTIVFRIGEETRHLIEVINDETIESSLFSDQYKKALSSLNTLLSSIHSQQDLNPDNPLNNILSFIGDRGAGKTSCMMSVAELLKRGLSGDLKIAYPEAASAQFFCVERLDPSFFDETHNVIELFLANLYNAFQKQCAEYADDTHKEKLARKVYECFSRAQKMMSEMISPRQERLDVLQNLQSLSAGVQLGAVIRNLVDAFFAYQEKKNGVLVLPIDDIDLNSRQASEMMEQIRKYLIQPNIVILLAVKLDQLALTKRLKLQQEYQGLFSTSSEKDTLVIDEMVEAYLTKLLPHQTRIYMPEGTAYFYRPVEIHSKKGKTSYVSVRQMVPQMIFKKTRYLFYNTPDKTSYIVPDNLRELRLLVSLLENMEDYYPEENVQKEQSDELKQKYNESNQYNKLSFRKYLFENWVTNNLNSAMQKSMQEILDVQDTAQVNAKVLACLAQMYPGRNNFSKTRSRYYSPELELVMDTANTNYNIAVGDVLDVIDYFEDSETNLQKLKFLFLLRSFISMRLYYTYDEITEDIINNEDTVQAPTRLSGLHLTEYDKQVAGYYINTRLSRIIPSGRAIADTRAERPIDFANLLKLIDEVLKDTPVNTAKLCLVEFFLLGISRRYDTQDSSSGVEYRKSDAVFYAESLENLAKNAYFDVGALLFNLTRMESCYARFHKGKEIYKLAKETPGSLLNTLRLISTDETSSGKTSNQLDYCNDAEWLSWCCFRNAEIIHAFKAYMLNNRSYRSGVVNIMAQAFKRMGEFTIKSYDKRADGTFYDINCSYLKKIGDVLDKEEIQENFMHVFVRDERPMPEQINLNECIRGVAKDKNLKTTRIKKLHDKYPIIGKYYRDEVNTIFAAYQDYMTREEVIRAINQLDDDLANYRTK